MKYKILRLVVLTLIIFTDKVLYVSADYYEDASEQQQEHRKQELQKLKLKIKNLRSELDEVRTLHDQVRQDLRTTELDISKRVENLNQLKHKVKQQNKKMKQLQDQRRDLKQDLALQRELLGQQLRTAYAIGKQEYIKLLFNQENPSVVGRVLTYYDYFNQARYQRIDLSNKTLASLTQVEKRIQQELVTLQTLKQQQIAEQQNLEKSYKDRAIVMAKLTQEIQNKDSALHQMLENEKHLNRLLNVITESMPEILVEAGKRQPFSKLKGKLFWPAVGTIESLFGKRRNTVNVKWNGVIIKARQGNNVRAISHGRVAYADWLRGYGLLIIIDHGDGYMSLYGYNENVKKETGDWVEAGEIISSVGDTGGQSKAGLYFEIRHKGKPTNPKIWCHNVRQG